MRFGREMSHLCHQMQSKVWTIVNQSLAKSHSHAIIDKTCQMGWMWLLHFSACPSCGELKLSALQSRGEEPPYLPPIPPTNEDQKRRYRGLNQPQVNITYVLMNLRACAGLCKRGGPSPRVLSALLGGHSQQNHMGYQWQATPRHSQGTPLCLITWYTEWAGSWIVCVIIIMCCDLSYSLLSSQLLRRSFQQVLGSDMIDNRTF